MLLEETTPRDLQRIIHATIQELRLPYTDIVGKGGSANLHKTHIARQIICWIARRDTGHSYDEIARSVGRERHSTAKHADKRADERRLKDAWFQKMLTRIRFKAASL